jgi:hypothetical protein
VKPIKKSDSKKIRQLEINDEKLFEKPGNKKIRPLER